MKQTVVVAALIQEGDRFLLTQRPSHQRWGGYWEFPGGKVEFGEDLRQALQREIYEELGLQVQVGDVLDYVSYVQDHCHWIVLFFWSRLDPPHQQPTTPLHHAWVSEAELTRWPILPPNRPIVRRLLRQLNRPTASVD